MQPASTQPVPPAPAPVGNGKDPATITAPFRELAALILAGAAAVFLVVAFLDLFFVIDGFASLFGVRAEADFPEFVGPWSIGFPLGAVLLATHVKPVVARARLITLGALIEYGVAALFGVITLLATFIHEVSGGPYGSGSIRTGFFNLLDRLVWLGLLAFAGYLVLRIWRGVFSVPRPQAPPQGYGYGGTTYGGTTYGAPGYPQQPAGYGAPGYPQQYGQPGYPPAAPPAAPPAGYPSYPPPAPQPGTPGGDTETPTQKWG
jgi:hypothetical protein